jgi:hypothetical protein
MYIASNPSFATMRAFMASATPGAMMSRDSLSSFRSFVVGFSMTVSSGDCSFQIIE